MNLPPMVPCDGMKKWLEAQTNPEQVWLDCPSGYWMLWFCGYNGVEQKLLVEAACDCADLALKYVDPDALLACIWATSAARRCVNGETDFVEVAAALSAINHFNGSCSPAAAAAARLYSVDTTFAPYRASAAAEAAEAAVEDAETADGVAASKRVNRACADRVREHIPWAVVARALDGEK